MGIRFRKSMKIAPGVRLNFGKNSIGVSAGVKGARVSVNSKGRVTKTLSVPGTGLSYVTTSKLGNSKTKEQSTPSAPPEPPEINKENRPKEPKGILRWLAYIIIAFIATMVNPYLLYPVMLIECVFNYFYVGKRMSDQRKKKRSRIITTVFLIFSVLGCVITIGAPGTPSVEALSLSADTQTLDVNKTETIAWTYAPEGADISQVSAEVSDSSLAEATIDPDGNLILKTLSKEGNVNVTLKDGSIISNVVTFSIVDAEKEAERIAAELAEAERLAAEQAAAQQAASVQEGSQQTNSRTVYITPTGKKYHYDSSCNGGNYYPSTLDEALSMGLTPCNKCVG